jgi:hypothetical protein
VVVWVGWGGWLGAKQQIVPVVRFAVTRRVEAGAPDYWDYATLLELAVLDDDWGEAHRVLGLALSHVRESWESGTTAANLSYIRAARAERGEDTAQLTDIVDALNRRAGAR